MDLSRSISQGLLDELTIGIASLKRTIDDAQNASLRPETLENVAELATLRTHSLLETFLQETFYLALLGEGSIPGSGSKLTLATRHDAELVMLGAGERKGKFLSWLPIDRTIEKADAYLIENNPFERLKYRPVEREVTKELAIVRNTVAHPSDTAFSEFQKLATAKNYPTSRAADYLLSKRGGDLEVLLIMTRVEIIARSLLQDEASAASMLEPELDFQASQKAPAGRFECVRCANPRMQSIPGALGSCAECETLTACDKCGRKPASSSSWRRRI